MDQTNYELVLFLVNFCLPLAIGIFLQATWPPLVKGLFAVGCEAVITVVETIAGVGFGANPNWIHVALAVLVGSIVGYQARWKNAIPKPSQPPTVIR